MIWIYGGGFIWGSGQGANFLSNYLYDGEEIASRGKVIVVTFNYRLGPLGFLSTGDAALPVFGESAGAASVSLQTLSPYSKGLMKRAISQSGVGLCSWAIQKDPLYWAIKTAQKVGCPTDNTTVMANCLRITDPKTLTLAYHLELTNLRCKTEWERASGRLEDEITGKTYSYLFSEPSRMPVYPGWVGADHADDIQYVFGKPFATPLGYRARHRTLSKAMIAYWTNFARTGDPNRGESEVPIAWVPYDKENSFYLDINHDINYNSVKQGLRDVYVKFWNVAYRNLPNVRTAEKRE
ncbi:PREDICTED: bile salt-activated lipase [Thamnophis sirtalis]|uniref:Bile salt-activated lipase n=1 Tax=Thamnophis sirtalis TaxID=35019 RepID=A0A6I9XMF7_9SAUR|nr:PREDICTED: bile salt-activated lipase [Thamnophis sirtalis]